MRTHGPAALSAFCVVLCCSLPGLAAELPPKKLPTLETSIFSRALAEAAVEDLVEQLTDHNTRDSAARHLRNRGQGWQELIDQFADAHTDVNVREVCAEIVEALDDDWKTSAQGREYQAACRSVGPGILSEAFRRLRKNPTDLAASAAILSFPPETVWNWLNA